MPTPTPVTIAQALASDARDLLVLDSATDIANGLPDSGLVSRVTSFTVSAPASLNFAQLTLLMLITEKLHAPAGALKLTGSTTVTYSQMAALQALPGISFSTPGSLTVADSMTHIAAMLTNDPGAFGHAGTIRITLDGSAVTALEATQLNNLAAHGHTLVFVHPGEDTLLTIADTAANLAINQNSLHALATHQALTYDPTDVGGGLSGPPSTTVTIAQALVSQAAGLQVLDTGANIANALPNTALVSRVISFTVSGSANLTVAQLTQLEPITAQLHASPGSLRLSGSATLNYTQMTALQALPGINFSSATSLTVADNMTSIASMLTNDPGGFGPASVIRVTLDGSAITGIEATQLNNLAVHGHALVFVRTGAYSTLTVADTASNLAVSANSLNALAGHQALNYSVTNAGSAISAQTAVQLSNLHGFSPSASNLSVADSGNNIDNAIGAIFGKGFAHITVNAGTFAGNTSQLLDATLSFSNGASATLSQNASVTVSKSIQLAALPSFTVAPNVSVSLQDTAANLQNLPATPSFVNIVQVSGTNGPISAAWAAHIGNLLHFQTGGASITVEDSLANLAGTNGWQTVANSYEVLDSVGNLALNAGSSLVTNANTVIMSASAQVDAAVAGALGQIARFSLANGTSLTVADNASNIANNATAIASLASVATVNAASTVTTAQADALTSLSTASLLAFAQGAGLTVADTPADLLNSNNASGLALAGTIELNANAIVSVGQFELLRNLTGFSTGPGHQITVQDNAANLLSLAGSNLSLATTLELLAPATVTAAQADTLTGESGYTHDSQALTISGTAAQLAALSAPVVALASTENLSASAVISYATLQVLASLPNLTEAAGALLTVNDSLTTLLNASPAVLALASGGVRLMPGSSVTISAANAVTLADLPHFSAIGATIVVSDSLADLQTNTAWERISTNYNVVDSAANIAATPGNTLLTNAGSITLSGPATISASQAITLTEISHFATGGNMLTAEDTALALISNASAVEQLARAVIVSQAATLTAQQANALGAIAATISGPFTALGGGITISDTASDLLMLSGNAPLLASAILVTGAATLSASQFSQLAALPHISANDAAITIADSAANILAISGSLSLAGAVILTANATVNVAQLTSLLGDPGFSAGGHVLSISDNAAELLSIANGNFTEVSAVSLSQDATVNAQQAQTLFGEPNFSAGAYHLTITDTAANLTAIAGTSVIAGASAVIVSASAQLSAAAAAELAQISNLTQANGVTLSVADSAANIANSEAALATLGCTATISAPGTVTASQAAELAVLSNAHKLSFIQGASLTVTDSPANLLNTSNASGLTLAGSIHLNASATLNVSQFGALRAISNFSTGAGNQITIQDNATNLLSLAGSNLALVTTLELVAPATVGASQAATLTGEAGYTSDNQALTIADTAAQLASLAASVVAFASSEKLTSSAVVSVATLNALAALPNLSEAAGVTLTVNDSIANLLTASPMVLALATGGVRLTPGTSVSISAVAADTLANLPNFSNGGATIIVSDSLANLQASDAWKAIDSSWNIVDSAANIAAASGTSLLLGAGAISLSGAATISISQLNNLAATAHFSNGGYTLTVEDTANNLIGDASAVEGLAGAIIVSQAATLSASQANTLGGIAAAASGHVNMLGGGITITDSVANLLTLTSNAASMASAILVNAAATVTASQFAQLAALQDISANGCAITIADSANNILAIAGSLTLASTVILTGNAIVTAAQLISLLSDPGFSAGDHVLSVADTATNLLGIGSNNLNEVSAVTLSANATVSVQQAETLFGEPNFSVGIHHLTISDTATNLATLPSNISNAAYALTLSGPETVSVHSLSQLASIGSKFFETFPITCEDTVANLATLTVSELALSNTQVISQTATVNAQVASELNALPHLSLNSQASATLIVQDTLSNLIAMNGLVPSVTSVVQLIPGTVITMSVAQSAALESLPHFSGAGSTITVTGSYSDYANPANAGYGGNVIDVVDTAANLATHASSVPIAQANLVTLSANATVSAATAAILAGIAHYSTGAVYQLTVNDTASNVAPNAAALLTVANAVVVDDTGPISAATADELVLLQTAGILSFSGGALEVADSYTNLASGTNASGVALAGRINVVDSASNLIAAAAHNWGAITPSYTLNQTGTITGAQAVTLAGLSTHFASDDHTLTVADTALGVVLASSAIASLSITATVTDSAANVDSEATQLANLGSVLTSVAVTDNGPMLAATAAGLSGLAGKLNANTTLHVLDNMADVHAVLNGLDALGTKVIVAVTDSAANLGTYANDIGQLPAHFSVTLTDNAPVLAGVAASLVLFAPYLVAGTTLNVTDTGNDISQDATQLAALGTALGTVTLSDGTTVSAAEAASLATIDSHLGSNVQLHVTGTAADITTNEAGLAQLENDHRIASITVTNDTVQDVLNNSEALNTLGANVSISDSVVNISSSLPQLSEINGLNSITITSYSGPFQEGNEPAFPLTVSQLGMFEPVLSLINGPYYVEIEDTAQNIANDLNQSTNSLLAGCQSHIFQIVPVDELDVVLSASAVLTNGIGAGNNPILAKLDGNWDVTNASIVQFGEIISLPGVTPNKIAVIATAQDISTNLTSNTPTLISDASFLSGITVSDDGVITVPYSVAVGAGVDDSASSLFGLMSGGSLTVTGVTVGDLASLNTLYILPSEIAISDIAQDIQNDLALGAGSVLLNILPSLATLTVSDGGTISLTEAQLLSPGIDGPNSVLAHIVGGSLVVTEAAAADLPELLDLTIPPASIAIDDTATQILSNLNTVLQDIAQLSGIIVSSGTLTLTASEALMTRVDDGAGSLIDKLAGHVFNITNASVTQLGSFGTALADAPFSVGVTDSLDHILSDLTGQNSTLAANVNLLSSITVNGGTLTLNDAQANEILNTPSLDAVMAKLAPSTVVDVSGVPVSDIAAIAASGWPHVTISVLDSSNDIVNDLASQNSALFANNAAISSVTLDGPAAVNATQLAAMNALPNFSTDGYQLNVVDGAQAIAGLNLGPVAYNINIDVTDSAANVQAFLDTLQVKYSGNLSITLSSGMPPGLSISAFQYGNDRPTIDAITNTGAIIVTDSASNLVGIAAALGSASAVGMITVNDYGNNIVADLPLLQQAGGKLTIHLEDTTLAANLVAPLLAANATINGVEVSDTGSQIAAVVESGNTAAIAYMNANRAELSAAGVVNTKDFIALNTLSNFSFNGHGLIVWDTVAHLINPTYSAALSGGVQSGEISAVYLKTPTGSLTVTAAQAATLFGLSNFSINNPDGGANALTVSDTATNIEAAFVTLSANVGSIAAIVVNASATINNNVLTDLQTLAASAANGVTITVTDSASNIASEATSESTGHSLVPSLWLLNSSAQVSEAQALTLASLGNFSTGSHELTLTSGGPYIVSVSQANALGTIAGSLNTNGDTISVSGSVGQLSALTAAGATIVTPVLSDSLANIVALPPTSPLLKGTVDVTGSATATIAQAEALLGLIKVGNGPGIAASSLTVDSTHHVYDTIADLQGLTSSGVWNANSGIHSDFALYAQDSLANLINPNNGSYLSGLAGSELSTNATATAANAEMLATIASSIGYWANGYTITVEDSVANLLNSANAAGIALADSVRVPPGTVVDTAQAEALLDMSHFSLNGVLTISDSSTNLLSGNLATGINNSGLGSYIHVQLAGDETVDADTAEALVSIPGFNDTTDLTISDDPSYLLNSANASAEDIAAIVTIDSNETVSANTILRLNEIPHFTPGSSDLLLASNDFADDATLKAIADMGSAFHANGHSITMITNAYDLTPTEYASLQSDNVLTNGYVMGVMPVNVTINDAGNIISVSGTGVAGATVNIYNESGNLITSNHSITAGFTISAPDTVAGHNFVVTETVGGTEGAPVVVLDAAGLETAVSNAGATFASTSSAGSIEVSAGKYIELYTLGSQPNQLPNAALIYNPANHTVSLDTASLGMVTLVTLGGTAHPVSLDSSEIFFKTHG